MGDLKKWVSDRLISLLGYSQGTVVQYVISMSKNASSPAEIVNKLSDVGLSSSSETHTFAQQIFARIDRKSSGPNLYQKQEREAALLAKKQKTYTLLEADDEDGDAGGAGGSSSVSIGTQSQQQENRRKRFRKRTEILEDEDDEPVRNEPEQKRVRRRTSQDESDESESEEERVRDQREREELERHIRERDAAGTRKVQ